MKKKDFQIAGMGSSNQLIIFKKITIMNMEKVLIVSANGMGDCFFWGLQVSRPGRRHSQKGRLAWLWIRPVSHYSR
jgi:hypothetical protein